MTRSANVPGARRLLSVKVHPDTFAALGDKPSTQAAAVLDEWAETHRPATDRSAPVEEDSAAKLGPGQVEVERGAMDDPDTTP